MFRDRFFVSLGLTIPVVLYSGILRTLFGFEPPAFPGSGLIPLVVSTFVFFYGGLVFLRGAVSELAARLPGMMTLISLAITVAFVYSVISQVVFGGDTLFWELTTLITVMLLGHWLEMRSVSRAQGALQELAKLLPDDAERIRDGGTERVSLSELREGDLVLVRPGARIPADGEVVEGASSVNESMITGESRPVEKVVDAKVIAGTVNGDGSLKVKVTAIGESTALAGIMRLVAEAQASRSRAQILADRAAFLLTVVAISVGLITFVVWIAVGKSLGFSVERTVAVLVIACPHALGLAIPLVVAISTTIAARNGLLVRDRRALEAARAIDVVLFDKTGTLTRGEAVVRQVIPLDGIDERDLLDLAASVEAESEHAFSRAIVAKARQSGLSPRRVDRFSAVPGKGVRAEIAGELVEVGNRGYFAGRLDGGVSLRVKEAEVAETVVFVARRGAIVGAISLADEIRPESKEAIAELHRLGARVAMVTGDSRAVADGVAKELGIAEVFAEVLPEHKAEKVKELQRDGSRVAMVGDGVNDAPALTQADVGIAIGAGTDVAIQSAGIILVRNDPRDVVKVIRLSRATYSKMIQNLFWAAGYNVVAIPLAAGVLASQGILLAPAVGAVLMSASTIIVAANAQLLRGLKL
ncbi:MAG: copper-translocating P-type ATPase [Chloroflexi bacterium 13_1_40CM_4_68_4]|nr:MAG: copper-translocating P-type ATPase [Chloroflexi bacterium 13_1_40CM_4_68_4]